MIFTTKRAQLLAQVRTALKAVPTHSTIEVLKGLLIEADTDANAIIITSTNYESVIQCRHDTYVDEGGGMVIDAKLCMKMLSLLGEDDVSIRLKDNICTLRSGSAEYRIKVQPPQNYPKPEIPRPEATIQVTHLTSMAKDTVFAASTSQNQPVLTGIRLEIAGGNMRACGCDGSRLMETRRKLDNVGSMSFVIPAHSFQTLSGLIKDTDTVEVGIAGQSVVFTKENFLFSSRLIAGEYINVDSMIATLKPEHTAAVNAEEITKALDAIMTVSGNTGRMSMSFALGMVKLSYHGENGNSETVVTAEAQSASPSFYFSVGYLYKAYRHMSGSVEMSLTAAGMLLVKSENDMYFQIPMKAPVEPKKKTKQAA